MATASPVAAVAAAAVAVVATAAVAAAAASPTHRFHPLSTIVIIHILVQSMDENFVLLCSFF